MSKELLAVLDMTDIEQWDWVCRRKLVPACDWSGGRYHKNVRDCILADLAYRLRDEVMEKYGWRTLEAGIMEVSLVRPIPLAKDFIESDYLAYLAPPFVWIIAALIAKGMADAN